jgi:ribosomal protein S18 acetylase RimI-like enzyme
MVGGLVLNKTGLDDIFPENIIMFIATHPQHRQKGVARKMVRTAKEFTNGEIAIHIKPNNPFSGFLSKSGFSDSLLQLKLSDLRPE